MLFVSVEPCCTCPFFAIYTDRHLSGLLLLPSPIRPRSLGRSPSVAPKREGREDREGDQLVYRGLETLPFGHHLQPLHTSLTQSPSVEATPTRLENGRARTTHTQKKKIPRERTRQRQNGDLLDTPPPTNDIYNSSTLHEPMRHAHPTINCALCASSDPMVS